MRPSRRDIIIATRRSTLATTQAEAIGAWLGQLHPTVKVRYALMESEGDRVDGKPLASIGGKGLFTGTIERSLLRHEADIAVHSHKDLPTNEMPGLMVAAVPLRAPAHDVLVSRHEGGIAGLPQGALVGTCSPRRAAQLVRLRPDLRIQPLRGNVDTRVRKVLSEKLFDATLLAAAGLLRMRMNEYTTHPLSIDEMLPAAGQGALAIQVRGDDHVSVRRCLPLNDSQTGLCVRTERQVVAGLHADCFSPVAAHVCPTDNQQYRIRVRVLRMDGGVCLEADESASIRLLSKTAETVVEKLLQQGARDLIADAKGGWQALFGHPR